MKNDSMLGGRKISIPPTVLFSAIAKMEDVSKAVSLDAKFAGDDIYVIGTTKRELGGSEFYAMLGYTGNRVPEVDADYAKKINSAVSAVTDAGLAHSLHAPSIGGLAAGFAKIAIAGCLGLEIDTNAIPCDGNGVLDIHELLFSESNSRYIMTASPDKSAEIAEIFRDIPFAKVGQVTDSQEVDFKGSDVTVSLSELTDNYKSPLSGV
jgi:phosphoribosylformylglycinamidine synthase